MENKDGIIGMLRAFKIAVDRLAQPIKFVITGDVKGSTEYKMVANLISKEELSDLIIFTGFLDKEELGGYLMHSSLAIINKSNNIQNQFCFPTKLSDYLMYEVPLIITSVGESAAYLKNGINAHIVDPEDTNMLASKIIQVLRNPEQSKSMAKKAKSLIEKDFNYSYQGQRLFEFLRLW
jgi:glycosyltransferase involved in cell wall biosynthesis